MPNLSPVDFDPFAASVQSGVVRADVPEGVTRVVVGPSTSPKLVPVDEDPFAGPSYVDTATGLAKAAGVGLAEGAVNIAGLPGDLRSAISAGVDYAAGKLSLPNEKVDQFKTLIAQSVLSTALNHAPTSPQIKSFIEGQTGQFYQPKTRAESYAKTAAEFVPLAVAPELAAGRLANVARSALTFGVVPGLASEAAGQATKGSGIEPYARVGAALAAGGAGALVGQPNSVERAIRSNMSQGVDEAALQRASALMDDAASHGITLTWPEALEQVHSGAGLTNLLRIIESAQNGREVLAPVFARRPAEISQAAGRMFDTVAPPSANPSSVGPAIGQAAEGVVGDVQGAINRASRPFYQAAETQRVGPQVHNALVADPLYAQTLQEVRNNPALNRTIEQLPDDSVGVIDLVQRRMREQADNARMPGQASTSNLAASNFEDARTVPMAAADRVTGSRPGVMGSYETARDMQSQMRQQYLQPIVNGPLGRLAKHDITTKNAIEALFPANPLPNSAQEIERTMAALAARDPHSARSLLRIHTEGVFNEAAKNLQSGPNQFGGAKFATRLVGNSQQRANLQAAVEASGPDGPRVWAGWNRFLDVMEATGTRQAQGSKTSFNTQDLKDLSSGGLIANATKTAASPGKWVTSISDAWARWQLRGNLTGLAETLANPRSRALLTQIANTPSNSAAAQILASRIVATGWNASNKRSRDQQKEAK